MHLKLLSVAALLGVAAAQTVQSLNATLASNPNLSNLTAIVAQFPDLVKSLEGLSNVTILAPDNDAISKMLNSSAGLSLATDSNMIKALLKYHVLNGTYSSSELVNKTEFIPSMLGMGQYANVTGGQRVEATTVKGNVTFYSGLLMNSTIAQADVNFTGGTIHVINSVLTVPLNISTTAVDANLTSAVGALNSTGLLDTADTLHDLTVFVPNNAAFEAIGSALANISTNDLLNILKYHVVKGTVGYSTDLANNTMLQTVGGQNITIRVENGTVWVDGAKVITPDVLVANGVVHIIDNVLNPSNTTASPTAGATAGAPAFSGASSVSGAPFASGVPGPTQSIAPAPNQATSTSKGGAMAMKTAAAGPAMLFGGVAAVFMNL